MTKLTLIFKFNPVSEKMTLAQKFSGGIFQAFLLGGLAKIHPSYKFRPTNSRTVGADKIVLLYPNSLVTESPTVGF